jgi:hypothetical protein
VSERGGLGGDGRSSGAGSVKARLMTRGYLLLACTLKRAHRGRRPKWRTLIGQSGQNPHTCDRPLVQPQSRDSPFRPSWAFFSRKFGPHTNVGFSRVGTGQCQGLILKRYIPDPPPSSHHRSVSKALLSPDHTIDCSPSS